MENVAIADTSVMIIGIILTSVLCFFLAKSRGRDVFVWTFAGFLFGFLAVFALLIMGKTPEKEQEDLQIARSNSLDSIEKNVRNIVREERELHNVEVHPPK